MERYRHRATAVQAVRFTGDNAEVIRAQFGPDNVWQVGAQLHVVSVEGVSRADPGDWIVVLGSGTFRPAHGGDLEVLTDHLFQALYEPHPE